MEALAKPRGKPTTCNSSSKRICVEGEQSTSIARSTWGIVNGGMRGSSKAMPSPRERHRTDAATARQEDRNGFSPRIPHNGTWLRGSAAELRTFFLTFLFLGGLLKENEDRDDVGDKTEE